jgi:hypothetical protein
MQVLRPFAVLAILGAGLASAAPLQSQTSSAPKKPGGCVDVTTEAAFASVGYDHIVRLKSGCKKTMTCSVTTNVNPDPATVTLDPGETESVTTWRGSPAREFTANVTCNPSGGAK